MNRFASFLTIVLFWYTMAGCVKVGPDYQPPPTLTPDAWQAPASHGLQAGVAEQQILAQWWTVLQDPLLTGFIDRALRENLDLEQARARLLAARAKRDLSAAGILPSLTAGGSVTRSHSSGNRGSGTDSTSYSSGFDAGWELDLFGGRQRSVEAAEAQLAAGEEELRAIQVSLLAELALNYLEIRTYQTRLQIAGANLVAQDETLSLTEARYHSGLVSEMALQQAKHLVASTRAQIPSLQTGLAKATNTLAVLLGKPPGVLTEDLRIPMEIPALPASVAIGIPAETLQRRPDVRKAERQLAAQTAQIGVATAELYPSLQLKGSIGLDALSSGRFFNSDSRRYSFGPSFSWTLFDGGATKANIRLQSALQQEALAVYRATVLAALEEVESALAAYALEQDRQQALQEAVVAAALAATLAGQQYQAGLINFTEVLDARRSLLSLQDQQASSRATMVGNLIRVYKALGGGWTSLSPLLN
ncbi:MAG: efflux transporter outer membrane subunit [Desulforhopalus sp.]|nr:efflux transporter outer membrane subunit [Desulforhopalus sp.]